MKMVSKDYTPALGKLAVADTDGGHGKQCQRHGKEYTPFSCALKVHVCKPSCTYTIQQLYRKFVMLQLIRDSASDQTLTNTYYRPCVLTTYLTRICGLNYQPSDPFFFLEFFSDPFPLSVFYSSSYT